jgi:predicted PurR-regulated permease PerM
MSTMSRRAPILWGLVCLAVVILLVWRAPGLSTLVLGAFIVAYVCAPLVDRLAKRLPRAVAVALVMTGAIILVLGFMLLFVPLITNQYRLLAERVPQLLDYVGQLVPRIEASFGIDLPNTAGDLGMKLREQLATGAGQVAGLGGRIAQRTFGGVAGMLGALINLTVLVPMVAFYLLINYHDIWPQVGALVPPRHVATAAAIKNEIDLVLGGFVRGQLTVALIIGVLLAIGFSIVGIDGALVIGLLGGLLNMIPLVGAIVGHSLAILMAILKFSGWTPIVGVLIVIVVTGFLEQMVITPRIIGNKVGLPPLAVLLAVLGGGELFGFVGMLLAVPAAAAIKVLLTHARQSYLRSEGYGAASPVAVGGAAGAAVMPAAVRVRSTPRPRRRRGTRPPPGPGA